MVYPLESKATKEAFNYCCSINPLPINCRKRVPLNSRIVNLVKSSANDFGRLPLFNNLVSFDRPEEHNGVYYSFNYAIFLIILVFASRKSMPRRCDCVTLCVVCVADNVPLLTYTKTRYPIIIVYIFSAHIIVRVYNADWCSLER